MKPRRVIVSVEIDSSVPISKLRKAVAVEFRFEDASFLIEHDIKQIQINVVKQSTKTVKRRR